MVTTDPRLQAAAPPPAAVNGLHDTAYTGLPSLPIAFSPVHVPAALPAPPALDPQATLLALLSQVAAVTPSLYVSFFSNAWLGLTLFQLDTSTSGGTRTIRCDTTGCFTAVSTYGCICTNCDPILTSFDSSKCAEFSFLICY